MVKCSFGIFLFYSFLHHSIPRRSIHAVLTKNELHRHWCGNLNGQIWNNCKYVGHFSFLGHSTLCLTYQSLHSRCCACSLCVNCWVGFEQNTEWVKRLSCGQDGGLMLEETYGQTPGPNPAAPSSQEEDVKCCHIAQRTTVYLSCSFFCNPYGIVN